MQQLFWTQKTNIHVGATSATKIASPASQNRNSALAAGSPSSPHRTFGQCSQDERPVQEATVAEEAALAGAGEVLRPPEAVVLGAEAHPGAAGGPLGHAGPVSAAGDFLSRRCCYPEHDSERAAYITSVCVYAVRVVYDYHRGRRTVLS